MPVLEKQKEAQKALWAELWKEPRFHKYLAGIGDSTLGTLREDTPAERRDELCIMLMLSEELPDDLRVPETFQGFTVVPEVTGKFYAL